MLIVKRELQVSAKMYVCENWKSTNQTAIRGLMPHEIFSLYALDAYPIDLKQTTQVLNPSCFFLDMQSGFFYAYPIKKQVFINSECGRNSDEKNP